MRGLVGRNWWIVVVCVLVSATGSLGFSLAETPLYSASASLYVTSGTDSGAASAAYQNSMASQQRVSSYARLVDSDAVAVRVLESTSLDLEASAVKDALHASAAADTVLLSISATSASPSQAVILANGAADALQDYVAELETPASGSAPLAKLTLVSPADSDVQQVSPQVVQNLLLAAAVGVLVGLAASGFRERYDTKLRDQSELTALTDAPVLGSVPLHGDAGTGRPLRFAAGGDIAVEAYRKLRTNLGFVSVDNPLGSILVTSPRPGDGKTTTAINLASALAEAGKSVVLVDADLRRPSIASRMGLNGDVGLSTYLRGSSPIDELVQDSPVDNLSVLCSGDLPPNAAELLGSNRWNTAVKELESRYDTVIVDSPPVLEVTDGVAAASAVGGIVLVVRVGCSDRSDIATAVSEIGASHVQVLGVVANCVSSNARGYQYGVYGGANKDSKASSLGTVPRRAEAGADVRS
ncbi:polysaccharide biosynthesis tyrosine autokinase [Gordonia amicalis]|uniref:polysaccharide biosynthesis tyrosine autokinase n=1 Tax=Gordonia amicalis TaxID=89053 RepID=UPI0018331E6D|nr:polysaccharide biosynthesis tyrosine autokinase [Gordonia amicalis]MBA5847046.1 polysaccharide biosynthesis tyrosine autokinase [Gordonia amicalis]